MNDSFELLEDNEGHIYISVLCGSIGLYEIELVLDSEEANKYRELGIDFIKGLARKVQYEPQKYIKR